MPEELRGRRDAALGLGEGGREGGGLGDVDEYVTRGPRSAGEGRERGRGRGRG